MLISLTMSKSGIAELTSDGIVFFFLSSRPRRPADGAIVAVAPTAGAVLSRLVLFWELLRLVGLVALFDVLARAAAERSPGESYFLEASMSSKLLALSITS